MNVLITGAKGFVGKNLCTALKNIKEGKDRTRPELVIDNIYEYDIDSQPSELDEYCQKANFVFNLAGVNRPQNNEEFMQGNFGFASLLLDTLKKYNNKCPIMNSSSIQAELDNDYGKSKKAGEDLLFDYSKQTGAEVLVYRFPNLFGKWCRPNYNSAVATFCNNIANDLPITVNNRQTLLTLVYIDDVVEELLNALQGKPNKQGQFCKVKVEHKVTLGEIVDLLEVFKAQPQTLVMPEIPNNYLPKEKVAFPLKMNIDARGSFTELLKTQNCGQFSVNISEPNITKGEHFHNTKWEFFIVVSGKGLIQQRKIGSDEVLNFEVDGDNIKAVHMLPGYTHNIINLSKTQRLITLMWANEQFDAKKPDTFFEKVEK